MLSTRAIAAATTVLSLVLMGLAIAANDRPPPAAQPASGDAGNGPPGPPPEAVAACAGKAQGPTVSFTGRGGEALTGTCHIFGSVLAARPAGMGGAGQRRPTPPR